MVILNNDKKWYKNQVFVYRGFIVDKRVIDFLNYLMYNLFIYFLGEMYGKK